MVSAAADYLGRALALIANVVDPEMFLIGGGASASADVDLNGRLARGGKRVVLKVLARDAH